MSRETAEARFALRGAEEALRQHRMHCPRCAQAADDRRWDDFCHVGLELRRERNDARAEVERNKALDLQPNPDQEGLW